MGISNKKDAKKRRTPDCFLAGRSHDTHKRLRSAFFSLKRTAIPVCV